MPEDAILSYCGNRDANGLQVHYDELATFNEVVAAGTAAALVPIKSISQISKDSKFEYIKGNEPG